MENETLSHYIGGWSPFQVSAIGEFLTPMRHDDSFWMRLEADVSRWGAKAACTMHGVHRSAWYRHRNRPARVASVPVERDRAILDISFQRPAWGCDRIAYFLRLEGIAASSPTVQKVLIAAGRGRRKEREAAAAISSSRQISGEASETID